MQKEDIEKELDRIFENEIEPKLQDLENYRLACSKKINKITFITVVVTCICILLYKYFNEGIFLAPLVLFPVPVIWGNIQFYHQREISKPLIASVAEKIGITLSKTYISTDRNGQYNGVRIKGTCRGKNICIDQTHSFGIYISIETTMQNLSTAYIQEKTNYMKSLFPNSEFDIELNYQDLSVSTKDCLIGDVTYLNKERTNKWVRELATIFYLIDYLAQ